MAPLADFSNRLRKNLKTRRKWARRIATEAFRLYDRDIPEFPFIVDCYGAEAVVYDKRKPRLDDEEERDELSPRAICETVAEALELPSHHVHLKLRRRMKGLAQYEKLGATGRFFTVREGRATYRVNLNDYLDTGVFLDHRPLRLGLQEAGASGRRLLNLFSYTGTVSVAAALGGFQTTSIDLSNTYLGWAEDNFRASGLDPAGHRFLREDVLSYLLPRPKTSETFDLVFLDPPTFSNSKKMLDAFDVARDHVALIEAVMTLVAPGGALIFSTNKRGFRLSPVTEALFAVTDWSKRSIPEDFRDAKIHACFEIRRLGETREIEVPFGAR